MDNQRSRFGFVKRFTIPPNLYPFRRPFLANHESEDFRRYLLDTGLTEYLTKFFSKIMLERPRNPIEYLQNDEYKNFIIEELKNDLDEANLKIKELQMQNKKLLQDQNLNAK